MFDSKNKNSWPEVVGLNKEEAKKVIESEFEGDVLLVQEGSIVTRDFRTNRIRIFYNTEDIVDKAPKIG